MLGIVGMLLAVLATIFGVHDGRRCIRWRSPSFRPSLIGAVLAARVPMTGMPELVAMLHSFVGLGGRAGRNLQPHSNRGSLLPGAKI